MSNDRIAVIDVETTGLSPWRHDRIVELAVVVMSPAGQIEQEYDTLVNPQRDIGPTHLHRITAAEVGHAPTFADIAGDVLQLLRGTTAIAGHNVSFDRNFLVSEYQRTGVELTDFPVICTCNLFGRASLQACCQELAIPLDGQPHRTHERRLSCSPLFFVRIQPFSTSTTLTRSSGLRCQPGTRPESAGSTWNNPNRPHQGSSSELRSGCTTILIPPSRMYWPT